MLENEACEIEKKINSLIEVIWEKISQVNSKLLLMMSTDLERFGSCDIEDDKLLIFPKESPSRITEYIQSVIAATAACQKEETPTEESEALYVEIIGEVNELFELAQRYIFYWGVDLAKTIEDSSICPFIVEAQEMYLVRGDRYQVFHERFFSSLLFVHDEIFRKVFGLSAEEIVSGIMSLEYALSQGRFGGLNQLIEHFTNYSQEGLPTPEDIPADERRAIEEAVLESFSPEHYDVARITNWPEGFIALFTFEPGEADWYEQGRFKKWPIVSLPIHLKPFIKLGEQYYCFDYYSFVDNFYRTVQKILIQSDPTYDQPWQIRQKNASESFVAEIFSSLLPGCIVYTSNYYSPSGKKGNLRENDIIIRFNDVLLIVEVKAGSLTYAPPITDWQAHVQNYKELIEKADHQCAKTHEYLSVYEDEAPLLDAKGNIKAMINMAEITDIFELSVTIDDMNYFASKVERLSFLRLESGAISISVNDLMVYEDYFDDPFIFLHFLSERRKASRNKKAAFNDELDHLGMYIENNCYTILLDEEESCSSIFVMDHRSELNEYYCQGKQDNLEIPKPQQTYPRLYQELLGDQSIQEMSNPAQFTSFLLDFSQEAREEFSRQAYRLFGIALERKACQVMNYCDNANDPYAIKVSCFVELDIGDWRDYYDEHLNYTMSMMLANNELSRGMIILVFDGFGHIKDMCYRILSSDDIGPDERESLLPLVKESSSKLVRAYSTEKVKVGRNEPCPCGSGKKYKRCHGRNNV